MLQIISCCFTQQTFNVCFLIQLLDFFSPQKQITEPATENMTLLFCLPLLVVLLQPALCLYNCSSVYERTPGRFF